MGSKFRYNLNNICYLAPVLLFFVILSRNLLYGLDGDAVAFVESFPNAFLPFLKRQFYTNGKFLTDGLAYAFASLPMIIWQVTTGFVFSACAVITWFVFVRNTAENLVLTCALFYLFPYWYFASAGWVATTANYLYPLFTLLIICLFVKRALDGMKFTMTDWIVIVTCILFTSNQDQFAVVLCIGMIIFVAYLKMFSEDIGAFRTCLLLCLLSIGIYVIQFFVPGHINRMTSTYEMEYWLPQFVNWSLFKKLYSGYAATVAHFFDGTMMPMLVFSFLLFLLGCAEKKFIYKIPALTPCSILVAQKVLDMKIYIRNVEYGLGMPDLRPLDGGIVPIIALCATIVFAVSIIVAVLVCVKNFKRKLVMLLAIVLGAGSREMMGLSATLYASEHRTFTFLAFCVILCSLLVLDELRARKLDRYWFMGCGAIAFLVMMEPHTLL